MGERGGYLCTTIFQLPTFKLADNNTKYKVHIFFYFVFEVLARFFS